MSGVLGADPGSETDVASSVFSNTFATIPDQSVEAVADRVVPRQIQSGVTRGAQVIVGETGVPQVLSGDQVAFGEGFYVSKPNVDATRNTDPSQWIFNSNQNTFKIAAIVPYTYTVTATDASNTYANFSVPHGLSSAPVVEGSFITTVDNAKRQLPYTYRQPTTTYYSTAAPSGVAHIGSAAVDIYSINDTNINISIKIFDIVGLSWLLSGAIYTFKFYCLQETIVDS